MHLVQVYYWPWPCQVCLSATNFGGPCWPNVRRQVFGTLTLASSVVWFLSECLFTSQNCWELTFKKWDFFGVMYDKYWHVNYKSSPSVHGSHQLSLPLCKEMLLVVSPFRPHCSPTSRHSAPVSWITAMTSSVSKQSLRYHWICPPIGVSQPEPALLTIGFSLA